MTMIQGDPPADLLPLLCDPPGIETAEEFLKRCCWIWTPLFKSKFAALYLDQLNDESGPEWEWLVWGWLARRSKSVLAGPSRAGKSFLALEIALDVALGRELFGIRTRQGGAVYCAGEGAPGVKKRLRAFEQHHAMEFSHDIPFVLLQKPVNFYSPSRSDDCIKDLIAEIQGHASGFKHPLELVVIDTLAAASVGAEENSVKDMGAVLDNVGKVQEACGCHAMLVHHMDKEGQSLRGSTAIYANVEQVLFVTRDEQTLIRTVRLDKMKDDEEGERFQFELPKVALGVDETGRQVTSCVCVAVGERESVRREEELKGLRLSAAAVVFMNAFFETQKRFGLPIPQGLTVPSNVRAVVTWGDFKRIYWDMNPNDAMLAKDATPEEKERSDIKHRDTVKQRTLRLREELMALDVIAFGRDGLVEVCWHTGRALRAFKETQPKEDDLHPSQKTAF